VGDRFHILTSFMIFVNIAVLVLNSSFKHKIYSACLYNILSDSIIMWSCLARVVVLSFLILSHSLNLFIGSLFALTSFSNSVLFPIKLFILENLHIYFPCFLYHPSPESSVHLVFNCSPIKLMLWLMLFQLQSLLFGIHSLNMLSHQIVEFLSVTIWKLTFSDSLILPKFPCHLIICWWTLYCTWTMNLPNPCTRCATELDSIQGY